MTIDHAGGGSRSIKASEFEANCLRLMDEVAENGEEIVITKRGRPMARLVPCPRRKPIDFEEFFGADRDKIKILGDIISPIIDMEPEAGSDLERDPDS